MTVRRKMPPSKQYEVGHGKPPPETRFRKGQSGNPGGRPRGMTAGRATALALKEIYRTVTIREGDNIHRMPAYQAVLRGLIAAAAKCNGPALRLFFEIVHSIEQAMAAQIAQKHNAGSDTPEFSMLEAARRVAFLLHQGQRELQRQNGEASRSTATF